MKERPILFSGPMVRAILEGRKTQTRRVVRPQPFYGWYPSTCTNGTAFCHPRGEAASVLFQCPYGVPGDRLWARETWGHTGTGVWKVGDACRASDGKLIYSATDEAPCSGCWFPSIHMPRWASRITLEITDVRVQRIQGISEGDAEAEGAEPCDSGLECSECPWIGFEDTPGVKRTDGEDWGFLCPNCSQLCAHHPIDEQYRFGVRHLWDSINAKRGYGWEANPWVWAITFRRIAQ